MSNKKHTNTISIFNKCKANQHVVNHTSNTHVNGLFSITAQLDDDLDYLTQDENKNNSKIKPQILMEILQKRNLPMKTPSI